VRLFIVCIYRLREIYTPFPCLVTFVLQFNCHIAVDICLALLMCLMYLL